MPKIVLIGLAGLHNCVLALGDAQQILSVPSITNDDLELFFESFAKEILQAIKIVLDLQLIFQFSIGINNLDFRKERTTDFLNPRSVYRFWKCYVFKKFEDVDIFWQG